MKHYIIKGISSLFFLTLFYSFTAIATPVLSEEIKSLEEKSLFEPGERLTFVLKWGIIPAGEAVLETGQHEIINNELARHFIITAKSNSFVDIFYKVRDRIDGYTDMEMTHSVLYKKKQREGSTKRDVIVTFDWKNLKAQYKNTYKNNKKVEKTISLSEGAFDPLSAFYYIRSCDLKQNIEINHPITDGKKCVTGSVKVIKREKITVESGTYDTYLIEPDLKHVGGVFEKSSDAKIKVWITADKRRIPVKVKSKVAVGSFVGELISIEKIKGMN
ncbi:DUF3108 domain-containing protein [Candidatus Magnetomoraceae bacterium gMMP-15]